MDDDNPYASPQYRSFPRPADVTEPSFVGVSQPPPWRWEDFLIVPHHATLPPRCVQCGSTEGLIQRRQRVFWCTPWVLLGLFCHLLALLVLVLLLHRRSFLFVSLCEKHEARRRRNVQGVWALCILAVILFANIAFLPASQQGGPLGDALGLAAILILVIAAIVAVWGTRTIHVKYVDKQVVWLKKLPDVFYAHLPQLPTVDGRRPWIPHPDNR